jgi:sugar transferase (PEP-CTERM system associated)
VFRIFNQYVSVKGLLLAVIESCLIAFSLLVATQLRFWNNPVELALYQVWPDFAIQIGIVVFVCIGSFYCNDLYRLSARDNSLDHILRVEQSLGAASLLLGLFYFLFPRLLLSRGVFLIGMLLITAITVVGRKALDKAWQLSAPVQRVAILGDGPLAVELARELKQRDDLNLRVEGFLTAAATVAGAPEVNIFGTPVLGRVSEIESIVEHSGISRIVVALEDRRGVLPTRELVSLRVRGLRIEDAPTVHSALTGRIALESVRPSWFVFSDGFHRTAWTDVVKRSLDLTFGTIGFLCSLPLMLLVALAVRLESKGPVIYRQLRVGRMSRNFQILKFRSMRLDAEVSGRAQWATKGDPRVTRIGGFLRKYRLDELPQFINIMRGDMSFVGPRPERPYFVEELRRELPYYDERHSVRPGLTGWAQVQYSYGASVEDAYRKLEYDLFYLKNMSPLFDIAIMMRTIRIVVSGFGGR